jgi:hypothetical protein
MKMLRSIALVFGLLLGAASAFAQSTHVRANVPFAFKLGDKTLPAGEYTINSIDAAGFNLEIRNYDRRTAALVMSRANSRNTDAPKTILVFQRYDDQYFLSEIWLEGQQTGRRIPVKLVPQQLANRQAPETVIVAATLSPR